MAPVKEWLQTEGYDYRSLEPVPSLDAKRLTKEAVYRLAEVETVASLDLIPEPPPIPPVVIHPEQLWPQAQALAFQTIKRESYSGWESREPGLVIITSQVEVEVAKGFPYIDEWLVLPSLSQVDFGTQIAIIAFWGWQGAVHMDFQVKQVLGLTNEVILVAQRGYL